MLLNKQTAFGRDRRATVGFVAAQLCAVLFAAPQCAFAQAPLPLQLARPAVAAAIDARPIDASPLVAAPLHPVAAPAPIPAVTPAVATAPERANAAATSASPPVPACSAPAEFTRLDGPLVHTMRRIAADQPLRIVAIGSSSTAGAGASSPAASYPARLEAELRARFPGRDITVLNRGINGEVTSDMLARFQHDVIDEHPQLVLWQVGTNSVLRDQPLAPHARQLHEGIRFLKEMGADVILIDPQFSPAVLAKPETPDMVKQIAVTAKEENVDLFHRFAVMRDWREARQLPFDTFISPDQLHMNDWSYACVGKLLAAAIAEAATRPVAAAAAHPQ